MTNLEKYSEEFLLLNVTLWNMLQDQKSFCAGC